MTGIVSFGAYIPKYRISRDIIAHAWGSASMGGEKAVSSYDEDVITLAAEAASNCLGNVDSKSVDGIYFASTTAPYIEKQSASLIASVLDMRRDVLSADFGNSLRAGSNAIQAGLDAINSKTAKHLLVTMADCRLGVAHSDFEQSLGDGAASFLFGDVDVAAEIMCTHTITDEFTDNWRMSEDKYVKYWEDRFANIYGYSNSMQAVIAGILKKCNKKPADFTKVVLDGPNSRQQGDLAKKLGFDINTQLVPSLFGTVGNAGAANMPVMLVSALDNAKAGDIILAASYGDGAYAIVIEVTKNIEKINGQNRLAELLASKTMLSRYEEYVQFRSIMEMEEPLVFPTPSSVPLFWRDKKSYLSFYGSKCKKCGLIQHPVTRICPRCQSKDESEEIKLAKKGKIFTYAEDYLANAPVLPQISASIDLNDGTRILLRLTESDPQNPKDPPQKIGMPIEVVFRKLNDISGFRNYYWKAKPQRRAN